MKLFIWQRDTLTDYSDGMIVALAKDLEDAHRAIARASDSAPGNYPAVPDEIVELGDIEASSNLGLLADRVWINWGGA